ncbi:uncharacterized protein [Diadema antillarum]|uniref:uncharacterized protein n=1 Tax=Diadema antillarum TaxID=105358 RepID=UPI003A8C7D3B
MAKRGGVFDIIISKDEYMQPEQRAVPVKLADSSTVDPDELVECPYDKVHRIRVSRFPFHLMKCRKNYVGKEMFTCPFNARHLVPQPEARHHVANCPDKACIERDMALQEGYDSHTTYCKGYTKVPYYNNDEEYHHPPTENWDDDLAMDNREREYWQSRREGQNGNHLPQPKGRGAPRAVGNYQPEMRLPRQPAQAAAIAQQLHQQLQQQQRHQPQPQPGLPPQSQPRVSPPTTNTTADRTAGPTPVTTKKQINTAGLGRGQFRGRVMAANLWGSQPQPAASQPVTGGPRPGGMAASPGGLQNKSSIPNGVQDFPPLSASLPPRVGLGRVLGRGAVMATPPSLHPGGLQNGSM